MGFALDHAESATDVVAAISHSLQKDSTPAPIKVRVEFVVCLGFFRLQPYPTQPLSQSPLALGSLPQSPPPTSQWPTVQVARLYLVSDILHNCSATVKNASAYRSEFQVWVAHQCV
jgi:hypothetical protein